MISHHLCSFEAEFQSLAKAWLPRTCDFEAWGFHQNWSADWQKEPDSSRFLVFQGRLTWNAAAIGLHEPTLREEMVPCALHGAKGLMEVMWDRKNGGWWWITDLNGGPLPMCKDQKHLYGISFALYGLAGALRLTGDPQVKAWLEEGWEWTDRHAHDEVSGGMRDALGVDGTVLTSPLHPDKPLDFLSAPFGGRSQNTALHVLEALTEVYKALPNPTTQARLEEMLEIVLTKMLLPGDWLAVMFTDAWQPTDFRASFGHDIEAAFLIIEARRALGRPRGREDEIAERIALASLKGLDEEQGGFWDSEWSKAKGMRKTWWAQAEALGALALFAARSGPNQSRFQAALENQWSFIERFVLDKANGGWIPDTDGAGKPFPDQGKSHAWQGAYHEIRGLINAINAAKHIDP